MPTTVTETDAFVASLQRPNNGELADAASILLYLQHLTNSRRWIYNRMRSALFDITRAPYNADPTGGSVSTTGMQAAITAAAAAGGHVFSPPGNFRHGTLTIPAGVSIFGVPEKTYWLHDHATANGLVYTDPSNANPSVVQDIRFLGNVAATGSHVVNNVDARLQFVRCTWNGFNSGGAPSNNLQGKILHSNSDLSETAFVDCRIKVVGDVNGLHAQRGKVTLFGGTLVMPATYNNNLVRGENSARVAMRNAAVDCTARAAGGGVSIVLVDAGCTVDMTGCELDGTGAFGTIYGVLWAAGARVISSANRRLGNITAYAGNLAAAGSSVELQPTQTASLGAATTYTIANGVSAVAMIFTGAAPTITFPAILHAGQRLRIAIRNSSSNPWAPLFAGSPAIVKETAPSIPGFGTSASAEFVALDFGAGDVWCQIGSWGQLL